MRTCPWLTTFIAAALLLVSTPGCEEKAADTEPGTEKLTQTATEPQTPQPAAEPVIIGPPPKIVIDNPVHDFGDIDPGSSHSCQFSFSNQGQGVLEITKVQSTCGCTVPELKKKTYPPGENGTIDVTFRAGTHGGATSKDLYVLSNDTSNPKAKLTIKANVVQKITYEPRRFKLKPNEENAGVGQIKIASIDGKAFAISRVDIKPACMTVDYDPVAEANEFVITPQVLKDKLPGLRNGTITIRLTHPSQTTISIPFDVLPPFRSDPATLVALNAEPGKPTQKTIYILSNYGEQFEVESVSAANDAIRVVSEEKAEDKYIIVVDIVPPENLGTKRYFDSKLTVHIAGGETLTINCVASVSPKTVKKASN